MQFFDVFHNQLGFGLPAGEASPGEPARHGYFVMTDMKHPRLKEIDGFLEDAEINV
jgi:hypothetical protein